MFSMFHHILISAVVGMLATVGSVFLLKPVAVRIGLVDMPGGRKKHQSHVPLIGGITLFIGFCFSLLCLDISLQAYRGLLAGSGILLLIGVVDDFRELTPKIRLLGQLLAVVCLMQWGHLSVTHLGNLFFLGDINLGIFSGVVTFLSVLMFVNGMNMIDGHDGVAGSVALGQIIMLIPLSIQFGNVFDMHLLVLLALLISVFLCFNLPLPWRNQASIFLGDAGSTLIGFLIAWFAVGLSQQMLVQSRHVSGYNLVTILWILAYPLFDLLSVFLHRLKHKRSPFSPDRDHLHHLLTAQKCSVKMITLLIFLLSVTFGLIGFILSYFHVSAAWQLILYLGVFFAYLMTCRYLRR